MHLPHDEVDRPVSKPTVTYVDAASHPVAGRSIQVQAVDHPRFPAGTWVYTSRITRVAGEKFWTKNTAWIPGVRDTDDPYRSAEKLIRAGDDAKQRKQIT